MRFGIFLSLMVLTGFFAAAPSRAEEPPQSCAVPAYLLSSESVLPKVADAIKGGRALDILVVGSRSSTINGSEGDAYPARLQAALKERLPSVTVNVSVVLQSKKTADEVAGELVKLVEEKKPTLVIWQTGTVDAMRSVDPDDFRSAVDEGVAALHALVSVFGILIMSGMAWVISWYKQVADKKASRKGTIGNADMAGGSL